MPVVQFASLNKTVGTIADRDAITLHPDGFQVQVNDTSADPEAGGNPAVYRWIKKLNKWVLTWKSVNNFISFTSDGGTIVNDSVTAANAPENGVIWDVLVTSADGKTILAEVNATVNGKIITILPDTPKQFDGNLLSFKYATGSTTANGSGDHGGFGR